MNKKGGKNALFSLIYLLIYYVFKVYVQINPKQENS